MPVIGLPKKLTCCDIKGFAASIIAELKPLMPISSFALKDKQENKYFGTVNELALKLQRLQKITGKTALRLVNRAKRAINTISLNKAEWRTAKELTYKVLVFFESALRGRLFLKPLTVNAENRVMQMLHSFRETAIGLFTSARLVIMGEVSKTKGVFRFFLDVHIWTHRTDGISPKTGESSPPTWLNLTGGI
jgi:hypothetical protein